MILIFDITRALVKISPESSAAGPDGYKLVSQTDVIRFLYQNRDNLNQELLHSTVEQTNVFTPRPKLTLIEEGKTALEAFRMMSKDKMLTCVGVVNRKGQLTYNLSISDFRGMVPGQHLHLLKLRVEDFLKTMRGDEMVHHLYPITCGKQTRLVDVMKMVIDHGVHRCWVVGEDLEPIGLISLSDLICKFSPFDFKTAESAV